MPRKAAPKTRKPKPRANPDPTQVEANRQNRLAYERKRNQQPSRKELRYRIANERRDKAKKLGLCVDC